MFVKYYVGTKNHAVSYRAETFIIGRTDERCYIIAANLEKSMQWTFEAGRKEANITETQNAKAQKAVLETPVIVEAWIIPVKDKHEIRVSVKVPDNVSSPIMIRNGYRFARTLCQYADGYRLSAMKGNGPKWCKNIVVRKFFDDNLAQAEKTEERKNGEN